MKELAFVLGIKGWMSFLTGKEFKKQHEQIHRCQEAQDLSSI